MSILHDKDFYSWTQQQSALLRTANFAALDVANLIEEIEDMGSSERRALESRLIVLLMHLLKWKYQLKRRGTSWSATISGQRYHIRKILKNNPGLKSSVNETMVDAYGGARFDASAETKLIVDTFPSDCPWTFEQVIDDDFWPE